MRRLPGGPQCPQRQGVRVSSYWLLTHCTCQALYCLHDLLCPCIVSDRKPPHTAFHSLLFPSPCHSGFAKSFPRLAVTLPRTGVACSGHVRSPPTPSMVSERARPLPVELKGTGITGTSSRGPDRGLVSHTSGRAPYPLPLTGQVGSAQPSGCSTDSESGLRFPHSHCTLPRDADSRVPRSLPKPN